MRRLLVAAGVCALLLAVTTASAFGQRIDRARAGRLLRRPHQEAQFIVKFRDRLPEADDVAAWAGTRVRALARIGEGEFHLVETEAGGADVLAGLSEHPEVELIEPNYLIQVDKTPGDPLFAQQWGLKNGSVTGADVAAAAAWDYTTGSRRQIVAVLDTGIDYAHPDLTANLWTAPRSFTFTGAAGTVTCPAGARGINAIASTCTPMDDHGHGTHVAGIVGAAGDNGAGAAGVNWTASILAVKILNAQGSGTLADALRGLDGVLQIKRQFGPDGNVRVINASWGFPASSPSLEAAIGAVNNADILFVAAAGNAAANNDTTASFPANSAQPNVISVAATTRTDALAGFSNYGTKVHLGAPGDGIVSTYPAARYASMSGTSMATPFVAGAAALVLSSCTASTATLKQHLLASVDPLAALAGKTATGGRLNVYKAIRRCASPSVTIAADPASRTVQAGGAAAYTLLAQGLGGVSGAGTLTVTGAPAGVTVSAPGSVTLGGTVSVNVVTQTTAVAGTYTLTAKVTSGGYTATVGLTLIVQPRALFTLAAATPAAVAPGASGAIPVTISRATGFTGAVTVTPHGLPAGWTAAAVTIAAGATAANVTFSVPATATGATVPVTLAAASASPAYTTSVPVSVTVQPAASLKLAFRSDRYSVKAGSAASMEFTITASSPLSAMQFTLSGMPGPAPVQIAPVSNGVYRLVISTPASWAGRTLSLKLDLAANGLRASATTALSVSP